MMKTKKAKIDGLKKDFSDTAKKRYYSQNRAKRFALRFGAKK